MRGCGGVPHALFHQAEGLTQRSLGVRFVVWTVVCWGGNTPSFFHLASVCWCVRTAGRTVMATAVITPPVRTLLPLTPLLRIPPLLRCEGWDDCLSVVSSVALRQGKCPASLLLTRTCRPEFLPVLDLFFCQSGFVFHH